MTTRVLIADDQPLVRAGIAMLLSADPDIEVVGEVGDGEAALGALDEVHPDVVVMDVRMPGMGGVEATRRITTGAWPSGDGLDPPVRVLVLTTYNVDEAVYGALRAGASGFLLKDAAPAELVAAIKAIDAGEAWLDPAVTRRLIAEFAARPEAGLPAPAELRRLTAREREILVLVAHGLSNAEIATHLVIGEGTVKTHVTRVLMKLGLRDRAQAVVTAYRYGLLSPGDAIPANSAALGRTS